MRYSLSTSWNASRHDNGFSLIDEIRSIGFDTVELSFALTRRIADEILSLKDSSVINISSIHNMCPLPDDIQPSCASPDYYSLASLDELDRKNAVYTVKRTISYAKRALARTVVLHAGRVEIKDRTRELASLITDRERFSALKEDMTRQRKENAPPHIFSLIESLKELVPYAREQGVDIALENRYYYREIPLADELEKIFALFPEKSLFYWHDVGHAEVFERLGLESHAGMLSRFASRLIGVHLHDIIGVNEDHRAPGLGSFDFALLRPYLNKDTIEVIEVHQPAKADEIRQGVRHLKKILG